MIFLHEIEKEFKQKNLSLSASITNPSLKYCDASWDNGYNHYYFDMYAEPTDDEQMVYPTFRFIVEAKGQSNINGLYDVVMAVYSPSGPTFHDGIKSTVGKLLVNKVSAYDYRFNGWFVGEDGNLYSVNHILNVYATERQNNTEITLTDGYIDADSAPKFPLPDSNISDFKLYVDNKLAYESSTRLVDGYYICYGINQVVKSFMESNRLSVAVVRTDFYSSENIVASAETPVLYHAGPLRLASSSTTCDTFVAKNFLTPLKYGVVTPDMPFFYLYFYVTDVETITTTRYMTDGTTNVNSFSSGSNKLTYTGVMYMDGCYKINITAGSRSFDVYCVNQTEGVLFRYYNFFNTTNFAFIPSAIKQSPSTEYESASIDRKNIRYDIEEKLEFSLVTANLLPAQADQFKWLCRSRLVSLVEKYGKPLKEKTTEIIISDYKIDSSTEPNTPTVFEMTFEYADRDLPSVAEIY